MPFVKVTKKQKNDMLRSGGYRERDIVSKARFAVKGNKGRTVTFYKPHTRQGKSLTSAQKDFYKGAVVGFQDFYNKFFG